MAAADPGPIDMSNSGSIELMRADAALVTDDELEGLLWAVYVQGGFTDSDLAATLFAAPAVRARGELIVARDAADGRSIGMVIIVDPWSLARRLAEPDEAEMHLLAVVASDRGRGVGGRLVGAAQSAAKARGFSRMVLWTQPTMHAAHRLYERNGFSRAEHRDWQRGDRTFLVFQKAL